MTMRQLTPEEAAALPPGADHYRAYVGPPERYDLMSLSQIALLFQLGLRETDRVLDFGCGSLRLGRLLIPFLREGGYFGIEPNMWLVDEGFARELGEDSRRLKQPKFSDDASFDCTVFGEQFDFIMAQSVITHAGSKQTVRLLETAAQALKPTGLLLLSYVPGAPGTPPPVPDWTYPSNVPYDPAWLAQRAAAAGLQWRDIKWMHPGAQWAMASSSESPEPTFTNGIWRTR